MYEKYVKFSEQLVLNSDAEVEWVKDQLTQAVPDYPKFQWEVQCGAQQHLWVYSEDRGDPEEAANFIQQFLRKFAPDNCFTLSWSESCNKPAVGEDGGGAFFVTAERIDCVNASDWLVEKLSEFDSDNSDANSRQK